MIRNDSRNHIHCSELLEQQFTSIRYLYISKVRSIITCSTMVDMHLIIIRRHQTTSLTNMNRVFIRSIIHPTSSEFRRPMRNHRVLLHLPESQTAISAATFCRLSSQIHHWANSTAVLFVIHHVLQSLIKYWPHKDIRFQLFPS